jgi:hypothetical protein
MVDDLGQILCFVDADEWIIIFPFRHQSMYTNIHLCDCLHHPNIISSTLQDEQCSDVKSLSLFHLQ